MSVSSRLQTASSPLLPEGQVRQRVSGSLGKRHLVLDPSLATPSTTHHAAKASFDTLRPIMARLPLNAPPDDDRFERTRELPYIRPEVDGQHYGTLPFKPTRFGLRYTRSHLPHLNGIQQALWTALHDFRPLTADYAGDFNKPARRSHQPATAPHPIAADANISQCPFAASTTEPARTAIDLIRSVFNWSELRLPLDVSGIFYGVVFRSRRAKGSESEDLYKADKLSHEEAVTAGGLMMYWYGVPDVQTGTNLATCIWTSRHDARVASRLPLHAKAAAHAADAYETYELSRYAVIKEEGVEGVRIEEWDDDFEG